MYKLIILFKPPSEYHQFEQDWMKFLRIAEGMPGLRREIVAHTRDMIYGREETRFIQVHELIFDSRDDLENALRSPSGQAAGKFLIEFTRGQVTMLIAEHMEATADQFAGKARGSAGPAQDVPD